MFRLFESIRYEDGQFHNLDLHQARVNKTFNKIFPDHLPLNLQSLTEDIKPLKGVFKCRISYNHESSSISLQHYNKNPPSSLKIVTHDNIKYDYKFEDRRELNQLYELRCGKDDVLIARNNGLITDTSNGNICLEKKGNWFTPAYPLFPGIQREFVIREKLATQIAIFTHELFTFDRFIVINAMLPFETQRAVPTDQIFK
jgi:4-amino-4-deoxychorismate lyase